MKLLFRKDPQAQEPYAVIHARELTPEIEALMRRFEAPKTLIAHSDRGEEILEHREIIRIYTQRRKVYADSPRGTFFVRLRIYELEELLGVEDFVRISNSEIVNKNYILRLDFSLAGTIRLSLRGGLETYVSRRYVTSIRKIFER